MPFSAWTSHHQLTANTLFKASQLLTPLFAHSGTATFIDIVHTALISLDETPPQKFDHFSHIPLLIQSAHHLSIYLEDQLIIDIDLTYRRQYASTTSSRERIDHFLQCLTG